LSKNSFVLLSYFIDKKTPLYGNTPAIKISDFSNIKKNASANTSIITIHNHLGTHVDAPKHFYDNGKAISDFKINDLIFEKPLVINCFCKPGDLVNIKHLEKYEKELKKCDILLLKTGFSKYRKKRVYSTRNPGLHPVAAMWLKACFSGLKAIGLDSISVSSLCHRDLGKETHKILLEQKVKGATPILIIEDMFIPENLNEIERIFVLPLMVKGIDSIQVTVLAEIK